MLKLTMIWYYFTINSYNKLKNIYSRRRGFCEVNGIGEVLDLLNLPLESKWYRYKNRIFIFRPKHKIASFVITQNNIYCPAKCFVDNVMSLVDWYTTMGGSRTENRRIEKQHKKMYKGNKKLFRYNQYYNDDLELKLHKPLQIKILKLIDKKFSKKQYQWKQIWFVV